MTTCEWKGEAICEHCHKSVAYRVITAITCVTWRPNMAVCQVMMDCLTAVHRDNTQPIKHVLTTSRNNNLKTKKNIDNKNTKNILSILEILIDTRHESCGCFQFYGPPPFHFLL